MTAAVTASATNAAVGVILHWIGLNVPANTV